MHSQKTMLMFRSLFLAAALGCCSLLMAQQGERVYLNSFLERCGKGEATYILQPKGMNGKYYLAEMQTTKGKLKMKGRYADAQLRVEHGTFEFFHPDGSLESTGEYMMGHKSGVWRRFTPMGKELAEKVYDSSTLETIVYTMAEKMPEYPGGDGPLASYLEQNLNSGKKRGRRSKALATFIVEKDGMITDVKVPQGVDNATDQRIMRAIRQMPEWTPGEQDGQPVRVRMELAITL